MGILEFFGFIFLNLNPTEIIAVTFNNPNLYSGILLLVLPVTYALIFTVKQRNIKIILIIISLMGFANLIIAQSRSALLAHIIILIVFFVFFTGEKKKPRLIILSAAVLILFFVIALIFHPSLFNKIKSTLNFNDSRLLAFGLAIKMWIRSPCIFLFGNGIGSFKPLYFSFRPPKYLGFTSVKAWDAVHNEYLELLVDGGIISLAAFLILSVYIIKRALWVFRNRDISFTRRIISLSFFLSFTALMLDGLFSTNLRVSYILFFFYIIIALIEKTADLSGPIPFSFMVFKSPYIKINTKPRNILLIFGLIVLVIINVFYFRDLRTGNLILQSVKTNITDDDNENLLKTAVTLSPWNVYPHYFLINHYLKSRQFDRVYAEVFYVNKIIQDFSDIHFLNGAAYFSLGKYKEAEKNFEYFLYTDKHNKLSELFLLLTEYMLGNIDKMKQTFRDLIISDLRINHRDIDPSTIISEEDRIKVLDSIFSESADTLDTVFFRFYTIIGKIYLDKGYFNLAQKYFALSFERGAAFIYLLEYSHSELNTQTFSKDERNYLFTAGNLQKLMEFRILENKETKNVIAEANDIAEYLKFFKNPEMKGRLKDLYRDSYRFKNYRRLMNLNNK
jgi:tetratricopeptide (TPR) repeat protein